MSHSKVVFRKLYREIEKELNQLHEQIQIQKELLGQSAEEARLESED
ncbi:hypothetical protein KKF61_04765 [Patescibacteria group bacterium]|nr:hypothetical protein [Patescibacteria group bacterium]MBU0964142.1 hypothetical protein [Patescibacteria group bacterium]